MMRLLLKKNSAKFLPESFKLYMKAPCSRLVVKSVLRELGQKRRYRELLVYKDPLWILLKDFCKPVKTTVYIKEDFL